MGEYGLGIAVNAVFDLELDEAEGIEDGDAGLNFWDDTTEDPPETGKLEGLLTLTTEGIWDLVTDVATELYGIETAELRTRDGIPRKGDTAVPEDVFDLASVGESVLGIPTDNGDVDDVVVVGVVGDDKELKNAALAALFWLDISVAVLKDFSDLLLEPVLCFEEWDVELMGNMAGSDLKSTLLWPVIVLSLESSSVEEPDALVGSLLGEASRIKDIIGYVIDGEVCALSFDVTGCEVGWFTFLGVEVDIGLTKDMTDEVSECCLGDDVVVMMRTEDVWIPAVTASSELDVAEPDGFNALVAISRDLPNLKASCWVVIFFFLCLADSAA